MAQPLLLELGEAVANADRSKEDETHPPVRRPERNVEARRRGDQFHAVQEEGEGLGFSG